MTLTKRVRRMIAALLVMAGALAMTVMMAGSATATTNNYWWSPWYKCQFSTPWTYEYARWRIDYYPTGYRKVTYADIRGTTVVHIETVQELWKSSGKVISQRTKYPDNSENDWYVEHYMSYIGPKSKAVMQTVLTLDNGDTCVVHRDMQ